MVPPSTDTSTSETTALSELRELRPVVAPSKLVIESAKAYLEEIR
jgi:hypothetical protein